MHTRPLIQVINQDKIMDLTQYQFDGDQLSGTLVEAKTIYNVPGKDSFWRKNIEQSNRKKFLMTLQLSTIAELAPGKITFNFKDFYAGQYYKPNHVFNVSTHILAGYGVALAAAAIACNCPRVYTIDEAGEKQMQGSLFSGAISKSFERTDLLPLYGLDKKRESINLTIANELPENEYIDEVKLLRVKKQNHMKIAEDANGSLFEYNPDLLTPTSAISLDGRDISDQVIFSDDLAHDFNDQSDHKELNSVVFTFPKPTLQDQSAKLVIYGRQTEMLEASAEYLFSLFGEDFHKLNDRMDKYPLEKYEKNNSKRGISMNVFIKTINGWEKTGSFHYASIVNKKWLGMDIDVSKAKGEHVEIKLEAAYKLWELDYIGLSDEWNPLTDYEEVPILSAFNEKGEDVSQLIEVKDHAYVIQPNEGSFIELEFENNASENEAYVLQGTGYYHHIRNYEHKPDKRMLLKLKSLDPLSAQEISKTLDIYLNSISAHP